MRARSISLEKADEKDAPPHACRGAMEARRRIAGRGGPALARRGRDGWTNDICTGWLVGTEPE